MTKCVLCGKVEIRGGNHVFHRFPTDNLKRKIWLSVINMTAVTRTAKICSDHFDPRDYIVKRNGQKGLKVDATPRLISPSVFSSESSDSENSVASDTFITSKQDEAISVSLKENQDSASKRTYIIDDSSSDCCTPEKKQCMKPGDMSFDDLIRRPAATFAHKTDDDSSSSDTMTADESEDQPWISAKGASATSKSRFPTDPETRNIWFSLTGVKEGQHLTKHPVLCSDHFDPEDVLVRANESKYIKPGATPKVCHTLFQASSESTRGTKTAFLCIVEQCLQKGHVNNVAFVKYIPISPGNRQLIMWIDKLASDLSIHRDIVINHWKYCPQICSLHFDEKHFVTDSDGFFLISSLAMPHANLSGNAKIIQSKSKSDTLTVGIFEKSVVGDGSITILPSVKDSQLNTLKGICDIDLDSEKISVKKSARLNVDEEKNRLLIEDMKSKDQGICRICLHVFEKSRLTLFSTKVKPSEDKTIQGCLIEILPSISDSIKTYNEICDICYKHLLITKEFFKMASDVQDILKTVLKDQHFIFNDGIEEGFIKDEIEDTSDMSLGNINNQDTIEHILTSPKQEVNDDIDSDNQDTHLGEDTIDNFQTSPKQEVNEDIEPHNNISANFDFLRNDNFSDLVSLSVPVDNIISNDVLDNLKEQQNNVLTKLMSERFCPENQSAINNSVQLEHATIKDEIVVEFQTITESSDEIKEMLSENPRPAESGDLLDLNEISSSDPQRDLNRPTSSKTSIVDKQVTMSGNKCEYFNCGLTRRKNKDVRRMFRFPKDENMVKKWIIHCGNASLADLPPDLMRNKYLCEKHFLDNDFRTEKKHYLKKDAVPLKYYESSERQNTGSPTESLMVLIPQKTYSDTPKPNISHTQKLEECLLQELDQIENLKHNNQHFVPVSCISNTNDIVETFLENKLNVVLADFNIATQKRVVFVGELICIGCQQPKTHCECSASGGMCHKCGKIFNQRLHLHRHIKNCYFTRCQKCNRAFRTKTGYKQHIDRTGEAPECKYLKCKICNLQFSKEGLKMHAVQHPNKLCDKCGRSLPTYKNICYCARRPRPMIKTKCNVCGRAVIQINEHMKTHMGGVSCPVCNKKLTERRLEAHMNTYHKEKEYACDICDMKFGVIQALKTHVRVVHLRLPVVTCTICNIDFARRDYYRNHYRIYHSTEERKRKEGNGGGSGGVVTCKICKKVLSRGRIKKHALHHMRKRLKCSMCPQTFHNISNKFRHEKLHENPNYEFGCRICYKFNKSEKELQKHMVKSHSKDPKVLYQCYHCNEKFKRKFHLRVHLDECQRSRITDYYSQIFEEAEGCSTDKDAPVLAEDKLQAEACSTDEDAPVLAKDKLQAEACSTDKDAPILAKES